MNDMQVM